MFAGDNIYKYETSIFLKMTSDKAVKFSEWQKKIRIRTSNVCRSLIKQINQFGLGWLVTEQLSEEVRTLDAELNGRNILLSYSNSESHIRSHSTFLSPHKTVQSRNWYPTGSALSNFKFQSPLLMRSCRISLQYTRIWL